MAIGGLLRRLFGGGEGSAASGPSATTEYNGFSITPDPLPNGGQFNTAGVIRKSVDGVLKEHRFVRADSFASRDEAAAHAVTKAQQIIDEQGERIFR